MPGGHPSPFLYPRVQGTISDSIHTGTRSLGCPFFVMSVQENINRLLWDRRLVVFPDDLDVPPGLEYVVIKDMTLEDRNYYLFIRDLEERKARKEGVPTEGEIMENARQAGYWGKDEEDIETRADEHIAFLEAEFEAKKKFRSRQNIIQVQIDDARAKQAWVQRKKNEFRQNSAEYLAHEVASFMLLRRVVFRPDDLPLIPDDETFLRFKEENIVFLFFLIQEMMSEGALETIEVREMARSTEWRLMWTLTRENLPGLFDRSIGDLTINHKMLIYWSRVYDSAFENPEPPEDDVINDDELFDQWLADRDLERKEGSKEDKSKTSHHQEQGRVLDGEYVEQCICGAKRANHGKGLGERQMHAGHCLYGTWHKYTPEEKRTVARGVYGRNSKQVRRLIDNEQQQILRKGEIEEQHLRTKKTRAILGMQTKVIAIKK